MKLYMLVGPSMMTAFFFKCSTGWMQVQGTQPHTPLKQAYHDEMEKYVEAKKAY